MTENKHTLSDLYQMQSLPLSAKIRMTCYRIRQWVEEYGEDGVYISFSGGKDSTVLLDIVRNECGYKDIPAVFVDVPTQYPELRDFAKTFDNLEIIRPKISFVEVCEKYGFPLISKEVAESVQGARKYLTRLNAEIESLQTDRQTDRQIIPYRYFYERVTGIGNYKKKANTPNYEKADRISVLQATRGGYDRKYRRLRGIGEFTQLSNDKQDGGRKSEISKLAWMENEKSDSTDKGEYP